MTFDFRSDGDLDPRHGMLLRESFTHGPVVESAHGVFDWQRDERGGIPYQAEGTFVYVQDHGPLKIGIVADRTKTDWRDNRALHLQPEEQGDGTLRASAHIVVRGDSNASIMAAEAGRRALSVDLRTDTPYNIWETPGDALPVHATVYNGAKPRVVHIDWIGRDFDGETITSGSRDLALGTGEDASLTVPIRLTSRGIVFLEVTVTSGTDIAYQRTNVAVLPPHDYSDDAASSMFGIAAAYIFDSPEERLLLRRIGVRRSRHIYFTRKQLKAHGFSQHRVRTPPSLDAYVDDPKRLKAYIASELDVAEAGHSTAYELGNELNRWGRGPFTGDGAQEYVENWVRPFKRAMVQRKSKMKLIAVGLAGMDVPYARELFRAGLADLVDGFNLHPGRSNVTPDWAPDARRVKDGKDHSWSYFGALKEAQGLISDHAPGMELWLTEVYACTRPNAWWDDSYRHAAENVLLSAALALSLDVTSMLWFQLYDNIRANQHGARPNDREHHFGLVLRDLSPKPSLLAYAAAAEHLDGAIFNRWIRFEDETLWGLEFTTPRGPLAIMWSRADGYELNTEAQRDGGFYPTPEPWVETWKTKKKIRVKARRGTVTEVDTIGRSRSLPVATGTVTIELDGAPRMFYGLDGGDLPTSREVPGGPRER
ncbi:hypothetical protein M1D46_06165 [Microbacterium sp. JZ70]